jgi:hypothetical protein
VIGTVLVYRDDDSRPSCEIALGNGDRVQIALDAEGLTITHLAPAAERNEVLFRAPPPVVAQLCAGLVGAKGRSAAPPLRILAATVQRLDSARAVRAAFAEAAAGLA